LKLSINALAVWKFASVIFACGSYYMGSEIYAIYGKNVNCERTGKAF